jgi:serine/threonine protein kinase
MIPEPIFCLSMDADHHTGVYRFSTNNTVFYVEAHPDADIDAADYGFPPAISEILERTPRPSECNWADIRKNNRVEWSKRPLKGLRSCWHQEKIDLRDLEPVKYLRHRVWQVRYRGRLSVAKIARFEFELPWVERETLVYSIIDGESIGPSFLGHLTEEERVMGLLLEYVPDARPAGPADSAKCLTVLRKLHAFHILHTDTNIYNFLIVTETGVGLMCDFEDCKLDVDSVELEQEEHDLRTKLQEDIGQSNEDGSDVGQERLKRQTVGQYRI